MLNEYRKFKIVSIRFLFFLIVSLFVFVSFTLGKKTQSVFAQNTPTTPKINFECVGQKLADYMNGVIGATGGRQHVKLFSPVFNITDTTNNPTIMQSMIDNQANFNGIDAFAANTYTVAGVPASDWFTQTQYGVGGHSYEYLFGTTYHKLTTFTEFGNADNPGDIGSIKGQYDVLALPPRNTVQSLLLFNALGTNPDPQWTAFNIGAGNAGNIIASKPAKGGINSAAPVDGTGGFSGKVRGVPGAEWQLEIVNGPSDLSAAVRAANAAIDGNPSIIPIFRICTGNSCGFGSDPANLASFIRDLDAQVHGTVWVVAGPNEPESELWATPGCQSETIPFIPKQYNCNQVTEPGRNEYHSLRPYPASPCNQTVSEQAMLCGHDLTVRVNYEVGMSDAVNCDGSGVGTHMCHFNIPTGVQVSFNFNQSELPIAGNTQLVPNGYNTNDALSSKERTNEYVSWYLNGVIRPAEEEDRTSYRQTTTSLLDKVVNYSGPLRKLVPQRIQWDASLSNIKNSLASVFDNAGIRHNQIVGCDIPTIANGGSDLPVVCYFTQLGDAGRTVFNRLNDWASGITLLFPLDQLLNPTGSNRLPPLEENYTSLQEYTKDYKQWLAEVCTPVATVVGRRVYACVDLGRSSVWSSLFTYVPMSSTEDRVGQTSVTTAISYSQNDVQIIPNEPFYTPTVPAENLYFAHTEEDNQLSNILQETYTPQGLDASASATNPTKSDIPNFCEIVKSRSNAGDNLWANFPNLQDEGVKGNLSFTAKFDCEIIVDANGNSSTCKKSAWAAHMPVSLGAPKLDELWNRLVDGQFSVFKMIYPQIGKGGPITELKDLPASTFASYHSDTTTHNASVNSLAGDPTLERGGDQALLFIPHLGGVYDYFLKGIQKALRPKDVSFNPPSPSPSTTP